MTGIVTVHAESEEQELVNIGRLHREYRTAKDNASLTWFRLASQVGAIEKIFFELKGSPLDDLEAAPLGNYFSEDMTTEIMRLVEYLREKAKLQKTLTQMGYPQKE
jgi:hypothetical protein